MAATLLHRDPATGTFVELSQVVGCPLLFREMLVALIVRELGLGSKLERLGNISHSAAAALSTYRQGVRRANSTGRLLSEQSREALAQGNISKSGRHASDTFLACLSGVRAAWHVSFSPASITLLLTHKARLGFKVQRISSFIVGQLRLRAA